MCEEAHLCAINPTPPYGLCAVLAARRGENDSARDEQAHEEDHVNQAVTIHEAHCVKVQRTPLPGYTGQIVGLTGVCTCGWHSATHQVYVGASTDWAEQRARHQIERARKVHLQSLR